jgi:hypothetical protein
LLVPSLWSGVRVISIADMIEFSANNFGRALVGFIRLEDTLNAICHEGKRKHASPAHSTLEFARAELLGLHREAKVAGLRDIANRAVRTASRVADEDHDWNHGELLAEVRQLRESLFAALSRIKAFRVPPERVEYIDLPTAWHEAGILPWFPDAIYDIEAAGECLAMDLNTASVFHSMRIAEHGLRWLARKLKVKLTDKGKPMPITHATWDKVITGVKNRIAAARAGSAGVKKQNELARLARAVDQCDYMKDIWRNDVAHARREYNSADAKAALDRVRDFMQSLAVMAKA